MMTAPARSMTGQAPSAFRNALSNTVMGEGAEEYSKEVHEKPDTRVTATAHQVYGEDPNQ